MIEFAAYSKRHVRYIAMCIAGFAVIIVLAMNWSDVRFYASYAFGIPISPINRTTDLNSVRFTYSDRENKSVIFNIPKAYLWSIVDQHSKGKTQFTGIEVVFDKSKTTPESAIALSPYNAANRDLFEFDADSIVEIMVRSQPIWLPGATSLSETDRLNSESISKANELEHAAVRSDARVSEIPPIGDAIWKSEDEDIKWFLVKDLKEEEWVAKCRVYKHTAIAHPHWTCAGQFVDADGLENRIRFPIALVPLAPELRQSVEALLSQFRAP